MQDRILIPALIAVSLMCLFAACLLGATPMSISRIFAGLFGTGDVTDSLVIWQIRLPRAVAAFVVGAALGASGAALQGLLRNPLAEPGVLGVSAAASLAATFTLYYGLISVNSWALPIASIIGALIATIIITFAAIRTQSVVTLILIGVGISSFAGALMSLLLNFAPNPFTLADMIDWGLGSVANRSFEDIGFAAPFLGLGLLILWTSRRGLAVLTLGEEAASGSGVNLKRLRVLIVLGSGLATGAAVSIAGAIGFVGIVAPHVIRPFVGHDPARSILPSALLAGIFLVLADIGVRIIPTHNELKLGVVAALIGAPAFIWIAMQRRTHS
ncbi:MAG: FecCD family ABC transporter permease [Maricaulaceae bacterium]